MVLSGVKTLNSFPSPPRDPGPIGAAGTPFKASRPDTTGTGRWPGRPSRFDVNRKSRNTPAMRQPANKKRRRAGNNSRKRTRMDRRRSSIGMPPGTSHLERGGREFLQCIAPRKRVRYRSGEAKLSADGGAQGVGEGLAEALDVGIVFGFDHNAGELLGAGVAKDDAAVVAESGLGFGQGAGDFRERFKRRF